jgi:plastocyanin
MLISSFSPATLTVNSGATVNFINDSGIAHTVNFDGTRPAGVDDIGLNSSGTFARTFTTIGTFNYHCSQHAGMTGKIVVQ